MNNILQMRDDGTIELVHHGIKGQKWGVSNGPPYPLDDDISDGEKLKNLEKQVRKIKIKSDEPTKIAAGAIGGMTISSIGSLGASYKSAIATDDKSKKEFEGLAKNLSGKSDTISANAQKELDEYYRRQLKSAKRYVDLDMYPDDVIRNRVNRLNLEKQYKDLVVEDVDAGQDKAKKIIGGVSALLGVATAGATLLLLIKKLKD